MPNLRERGSALIAAESGEGRVRLAEVRRADLMACRREVVIEADGNPISLIFEGRFELLRETKESLFTSPPSPSPHFSLAIKVPLWLNIQNVDARNRVLDPDLLHIVQIVGKVRILCRRGERGGFVEAPGTMEGLQIATFDIKLDEDRHGELFDFLIRVYRKDNHMHYSAKLGSRRIKVLRRRST